MADSVPLKSMDESSVPSPFPNESPLVLPNVRVPCVTDSVAPITSVGRASKSDTPMRFP